MGILGLTHDENGAALERLPVTILSSELPAPEKLRVRRLKFLVSITRVSPSQRPFESPPQLRNLSET